MSAPKRILTHTLIVEADGPEDDSITLECSTPDLCKGWIECGDDRDGPTPYDIEDEDDDAWGDEEREFHGVVHTYNQGMWTVPYEHGCIVNYCDWERPYDAPYPMRPGRYEVDVDWDDDPVLIFREPYGGAS